MFDDTTTIEPTAFEPDETLTTPIDRQAERRAEVMKVYESVANLRNPFEMHRSDVCIMGHADRVGVSLFETRSAPWNAVYSATSATRGQATAMLLWLAEQPATVEAKAINAKWRELGVEKLAPAVFVSGCDCRLCQALRSDEFMPLRLESYLAPGRLESLYFRAR
jgi:hypothetical protein